MIIKEFKKIFPDSLQPTKIGKYHYIFLVSHCPVVKENKYYYTVYATNIENVKYAQASVDISLDFLLQGTDDVIVKINKVKKNLNKELLKLQTKGINNENIYTKKPKTKI